MNKTFNDVPLIELMPPSLRYDPQIIAACEAIQPEFEELAMLHEYADIYGNIDNLPEPVLAALAWQNQVYGAEWAIAGSLNKRRELVANAWILNRLRGTPWSILRIFEILGMRAEIKEWFEENAEPGTFRISVLDVTGVGLTQEMLDWITSLIYAYKPLTRHIRATNMVTTLPTLNTYAAMAGKINIKIREVGV